MKALATAALMLVALALPMAAAAQDPYPPEATPVEVECSFASPTVTCHGSNFEPNSTVQVTVTSGSTQAAFAPGGTAFNGRMVLAAAQTPERTDTVTANAEGEVVYTFQPPCANATLTVTMTGNDADGNPDSASDTVVTTCAATPTDDTTDALPRTGGGLAAIAGLALLGAVTLRRRS